MEKRIKQILSNAFDFLFFNSTYELGNFYTLWNMSKNPPNDFFKILVDSLISLMEDFRDQGERGQATELLDLILLMLDSLIFNLYTTLRASDRVKHNNSLYGASVASIPQRVGVEESGAFNGSVALQNYNPSQFQAFLSAMEDLLSNRKFFEQLECLMTYNNSDQNMLQLSILIDSLEYMAEKEGISEEALYKYNDNRDLIEEYIVEKQQMAVQEDIDKINDILFSTKLLKIKKLLSVKNDMYTPREVHFTIIRIYFAAFSKKRTNSNRKQLAKVQYSGEDMINSIVLMYMRGHNKRDALFKESGQPDALFDFIINLLLLLFLPVYNQFQDLFMKYIYPHADKKPQEFFQAIQKAVHSQFAPFFEFLPKDLTNLLSQIYLATRESPHFKDNISPTIPVTTLFINRFLLSRDIKLLITPPPPFHMEQFLAAANNFKDLFNQSKINNIPDILRQKLEQNITCYDDSKTTDVFSYFFTDPALRNDYFFLQNYVLLIINFNSNDDKELKVEPFDSKLIENKKKVIQTQIYIPEEQEIIKPKPQQEIVKPQQEIVKPIIIEPIKIQEQMKIEDRSIVEQLTGIKQTKDISQYEEYSTRQEQNYLNKFPIPIPIPIPIVQKHDESTQTLQIQIVKQPELPPRDYEAEEREKMKWYEEKIKPYKKQIQEAETKVKEQNTKIKILDVKLMESDTERRESDTKHRESEAQLRELESRIRELETKLRESEAKLREQDTKLRNERLQYNQTNASIKTEVREKIQQKEDQIEKMHDAIDLLNIKVEDLDQTILHQQQQITQKDNDNIRLSYGIQREQDEKMLLHVQFERLQQKFYDDLKNKHSEKQNHQKTEQYEDDYQQTLNELDARKQELIQIQSQHELHTRAIKR